MHWIPNVFRRNRLHDELAEEMRLHVEERTEQLMSEGLSREEAERQAHVAFGNRTLMEERSREVWQWPTVESMWADVRFALRQLRRSPGFATAAVLTLALTIGANAVVFGIMDGLVLRPLNVPEAENLYGTQYGDGGGFQAYPNYVDLRDRNQSFESLAAFNMVFTGVDIGNDAAMGSGFATSGNYFDVLRVHPYLGRFFHASDEHGPNSAPYVVLSYAYWHSRFQEDRAVVGRKIEIDKHTFTIIGVAPPKFAGTLIFVSPDFYMPIVNEEQAGADNTLASRSNIHGVFEVFGHLKPGVTPAQATAEVNAIGESLQKTYPKEVRHEHTTLGREGLTSFAGPVREFVAALVLLAGLILLAACANLGSLFSARASDRSREVALRLALGSSRTRILRQLLTEAMLISLAGGALGLAGSVMLLRRLSLWNPFPGIGLHIPVSPDAKIYVVALALALISGFLFGIVPVRQVLRANPYEIVKAGSSARQGRRLSVRDVLLVLQIAICAVLVTSSLVAVRGLVRSLHTHSGFEPENATVINANLAMAGYSGEQVLPMQKRIIAAMETIPGVEHVGLVNSYPPLVYGAATRANIFRDETRDLTPANVAAMPFEYDVSPGYFEAAGTTLIAGRGFSWRDDRNAPPVAVVNQQFARKIFGSVPDAMGKYYRLQDGTRVEVVGVAEDGKYLSLTEDQEPAMFLSAVRSPLSEAFVMVRTNPRPGRDAQWLASEMRRKLREVDAGLPADIKTWNTLLEVVQFPSRVATMALGVLGVLGAMLAITGIFGMAAYSVSRRLRELGIRVALGAQRIEVLQAALGRALKMLAIGSTAGLLLGLTATKVLAFIVYQATPRDPLVLGGVVLAMLMLGLLATWIPAQRALSVDPLILLRED